MPATAEFLFKVRTPIRVQAANGSLSMTFLERVIFSLFFFFGCCFRTTKETTKKRAMVSDDVPSYELTKQQKTVLHLRFSWPTSKLTDKKKTHVVVRRNTHGSAIAAPGTMAIAYSDSSA